MKKTHDTSSNRCFSAGIVFLTSAGYLTWESRIAIEISWFLQLWILLCFCEITRAYLYLEEAYPFVFLGGSHWICVFDHRSMANFTLSFPGLDDVDSLIMRTWTSYLQFFYWDFCPNGPWISWIWCWSILKQGFQESKRTFRHCFVGLESEWETWQVLVDGLIAHRHLILQHWPELQLHFHLVS